MKKKYKIINKNLYKCYVDKNGIVQEAFRVPLIPKLKLEFV